MSLLENSATFSLFSSGSTISLKKNTPIQGCVTTISGCTPAFPEVDTVVAVSDHGIPQNVPVIPHIATSTPAYVPILPDVFTPIPEDVPKAADVGPAIPGNVRDISNNVPILPDNVPVLPFAVPVSAVNVPNLPTDVTVTPEDVTRNPYNVTAAPGYVSLIPGNVTFTPVVVMVAPVSDGITSQKELRESVIASKHTYKCPTNENAGINSFDMLFYSNTCLSIN